MPVSGADPGFFLGGGAHLRNDLTDWWGREILKRIRKRLHLRGGCTPCNLPQDPHVYYLAGSTLESVTNIRKSYEVIIQSTHVCKKAVLYFLFLYITTYKKWPEPRDVNREKSDILPDKMLSVKWKRTTEHWETTAGDDKGNCSSWFQPVWVVRAISQSQLCDMIVLTTHKMDLFLVANLNVM